VLPLGAFKVFESHCRRRELYLKDISCIKFGSKQIRILTVLIRENTCNVSYLYSEYIYIYIIFKIGNIISTERIS
jgi:hypothetical protein